MAEKGQHLTKKVQEGQKYEESQRHAEAIKIYEEIIHEKILSEEEVTDELVKAKETTTYRLAHIFKEKGLIEELIAL